MLQTQCRLHRMLPNRSVPARPRDRPCGSRPLPSNRNCQEIILVGIFLSRSHVAFLKKDPIVWPHCPYIRNPTTLVFHAFISLFFYYYTGRFSLDNIYKIDIVWNSILGECCFTARSIEYEVVVQYKHSWASASRKLTPALAFRHP
jgi:hypothetical protein